MPNQFSQSSMNKKLAIADGRKTYEGKPCIQCGQTEKDVKASCCIRCRKERGLARLNNPEIMGKYRTPEKALKRGREWRKNNPEKYKAQWIEGYKRKSRKAGWTDIARGHHLRQNYGMTVEEYTKLLAEQNESCKLCGAHLSKSKRRLSVDHCHTTGKVRGLLCSPCNTALGLLKENIDVMKRAIEYLEKHRD